MYLFFDTETTGLPKDYNAPASDLDNWPRLVQVAWQIYDDDRRLIEEKDIIVKPEGFTIPTEASDVHRISTERALEEGIELEDCLNQFREACLQSDCMVAHNINFDLKIMGAEFIRKEIASTGKKLLKIDTMKIATNYCKIPTKWGKGYKWPSLMELHTKLFDCGFEDAHDALVDIQNTAKCFYGLVKVGVIKL